MERKVTLPDSYYCDKCSYNHQRYLCPKDCKINNRRASEREIGKREAHLSWCVSSAKEKIRSGGMF